MEKSIINLKNRKVRILTEIFITFLVLGLLFFLATTNQRYVLLSKQALLKQYTQKIMDKCKKYKSDNSCFNAEIPKLMNKISMKDAFDIAKVISYKVPAYTNCHELGHELSEIAVEQNPSGWKDVIRACPPECDGGCLHGALITHFRGLVNLSDSRLEKMRPELKNICKPNNNWHPISHREIEVCHHGLGHINVYLTNGNISKALDLCVYQIEEQNSTDFKFCAGGVFMSIYQATEPEEIELLKKVRQTKETVSDFCKQFRGESYEVCHLESFALFIKEIQTPNGIREFCSYALSQKEKSYCFYKIVGEMTIKLILQQNNTIKLKNLCDELGTENIESCFSDSAIVLVQISAVNLGKAIEICKLAPNRGDVCMARLVLYVNKNFNNDSDEYKSFCKNLPKNWSTHCKS